MQDFASARRMMVDCQLRTFDVTDAAVLAAMDEIPRELFVPDDQLALAYSDGELAVGHGRALLAPMVLARMIQTLRIRPGERALDVAGGLGYSAAILRRLGAEVVAVESEEALAAGARAALSRCGMPEIAVIHSKIEAGCPDRAPYDAILVNGAVETRPDGLLGQLAERGRLVCVEGERAGRATLYVRSADAFGSRAVFDAPAPALAQFRAAPSFTFG